MAINAKHFLNIVSIIAIAVYTHSCSITVYVACVTYIVCFAHLIKNRKKKTLII